MAAELIRLMQSAISMFVRFNCMVGDPSVPRIGHYDLIIGVIGGGQTPRPTELVVPVPHAALGLKPSLVTDTVEDLQSVAVSFRDDDISAFGVDEPGVVGQGSSVSCVSPLPECLCLLYREALRGVRV